MTLLRILTLCTACFWGLKWIITIIKRRRLGLFGHVAGLSGESDTQNLLPKPRTGLDHAQSGNVRTAGLTVL